MPGPAMHATYGAQLGAERAVPAYLAQHVVSSHVLYGVQRPSEKVEIRG